MTLFSSGCVHYADFTLPPLAGSPVRNAVLQLAPQPVMTRAAESDILNPSVILQDETYWNFYSEFDGQVWRTALATSRDGHSWSKQGRVLSPDAGTWERGYLAANGSALFENGQWWYWYQAGERGAPRIGLARSADGHRWRKERAPVLEPGPRGSWDECGVADPYVLKLQGVFYVYYLGQNRARQQQIGMARSNDGVHWTKLRSNPVLAVPLRVSGSADGNGLGEPAVWQAQGWYWMIYTGRNLEENRALITARSMDGVHWVSMTTTRGASGWDRAVLCDPTVVAVDGSIRLWFGGGDRPRPDENVNGQIGEGVVKLQ